MDFRDLLAYQKAYELAMELFEISKGLPTEERYSLIDQVRRSSRSTCANLAEAYRRRRYPNHFISKLTDSDSENAETAVWIDFSFSCGYIGAELRDALLFRSEEVGKLLAYMIQNPTKFGAKAN
ncbi:MULTISPECIES: four helix bundle protein [unclassified Flavobacterium]|uniref:four helix bundle protein n=1 Tax=unclassified Flavobacterium TaxID=196869 RepID=UPI001F1312A7|nr:MULTISPECIES: four helix bundle protein [unclassified Flavobacterium]UMY65758.1 four helix bundle protein [Flavobacterium sp. HJ-32-4]